MQKVSTVIQKRIHGDKKRGPQSARFVEPPSLIGYNYSAGAARKAGNSGKLLAMRLETSYACNFRCIYCNGASGRKRKGEVPFGLLKRSIAELKELGGKSVIVIGGGEPTIYPHFRELIEFIARRKMIPVIITNASLLTPEMVEFLYQKNASVLFKLDSFSEAVQDRLAGKKGAFRAIMLGLENLFSAGFNVSHGKKLRCGASFVVTRHNYQEIPQLWDFCRKNNLYPNMEEFIPRGRGARWAGELAVSADDLIKLKRKILNLDRKKYGYDWLVYAPLPGHGCLQHLYSVYLSGRGNVRPCADIDIDLFDIRKMSLPQILRSPFFDFIRNIEKHLEGKCFRCVHNDLCVGCRGNAFNVGVKEGKDLYAALRREDPSCWIKKMGKSPH